MENGFGSATVPWACTGCFQLVSGGIAVERGLDRAGLAQRKQVPDQRATARTTFLVFACGLWFFAPA